MRAHFIVLASFLLIGAGPQVNAGDLAPKAIHFARGASGDAGRASSGKTSNNGILYHGGPIMKGATKVYYIWYGDWSGNTAKTLLTFLAQNIGGSSYFNINTSYTDGSGGRVANQVTYAGSIDDAYSHGKSLSDADIQAVALDAIAAGKLPLDTSGVYFVLTSADVTATSGFCSAYCGWHSYAPTAQGQVKFAFIGNGDRCPSTCEAQTTSPNGNAGADGMASVISHELEEAVTDPELSAWWDRRGNENADKCAWTFGTVSTAANGSKYNVVLNGMKFLIQRNWVNASGGYCAMTY